MPVSGLRYASREQVFVGRHSGNCVNCHRTWGGHNGIACDWTHVESLCLRCDRRTGDHRQGQCEFPAEQFTLPVEFVELWGEIGKAHAADVCFQKYTPKTWPNKTLRKAKESGLSPPAITEDCKPYRVSDEAYTVGRDALERLMRFDNTPLQPIRDSPGAFMYAEAPPTPSPYELRWTGPQFPLPNPPPTWSIDDELDTPF